VLKRGEGTSVNLPTDNLIVIIAVGVTVGWPSTAVHGTGLGLISDMAIGIGDWLLLRLNVALDHGIVTLLINATIGAIILLLGRQRLARRLTIDARAALAIDSGKQRRPKMPSS
jgi:uncharacterized membrane protein YeaQ/YmgE (transglycosylase-associated protein family)